MDDSKGYDAQIIAQHQGGPPVEIIDEVRPGTPLQCQIRYDLVQSMQHLVTHSASCISSLQHTVQPPLTAEIMQLKGCAFDRQQRNFCARGSCNYQKPRQVQPLGDGLCSLSAYSLQFIKARWHAWRSFEVCTIHEAQCCKSPSFESTLATRGQSLAAHHPAGCPAFSKWWWTSSRGAGCPFGNPEHTAASAQLSGRSP